jgi:cell division protein FtsB
MRWVIALLALVLATLQLDLWFSEDRKPGLEVLREAVEVQSAENQRLAERNDDLTAEIRNLREGTEAAEERARSELGLMLPAESFYQVAEEP